MWQRHIVKSRYINRKKSRKREREREREREGGEECICTKNLNKYSIYNFNKMREFYTKVIPLTLKIILCYV